MANKKFKRESEQVSLAQKVECKVDNLRKACDVSLSNILNTNETNKIWPDAKKEIEQFNIANKTGGVNPGDRRAIYYLINAIKPTSVLEIGTHIGASTIHIASALHKNLDKSMTTVDIVDVNSRTEHPWSKYGKFHSPALESTPLQMVEKLSYSSFVDFVVNDSFDYMTSCKQTFDFIFLDGDHLATTVYREIPAALNLLNPNGVILLHDYFPEGKPLWSNGIVVPGPFLAVKRLINEGMSATVLPLGELPWETKCDSNVTSLALLLKNEN